MRRLSSLILLLMLVLGAAIAQQADSNTSSAYTTPAAADSGGEHGSGEHGASLGGEHVTLWKTANFALFIGLMVYFLWGKAGPFFAENRNAITRQISHAATKAEEAQARLSAIELKLAGLDKEIAGIREHAASEMARDRERIEQETAAAIQRLQERAESEIHSATMQAQARLRRQAAVSALELAEQMVKAEAATPEARNELLTRAVERLSRATQATRN
ncbi:MAG: ATP synthase F0 subunit B [Bryobacterales bacterium]|nr:ATP synthase F0 subunit B [Bryobacterales bacterium]